MTHRLATIAAAAVSAALAVSLGACTSSSEPATDSTADSSSGELTPFTLALIPSGPTGLAIDMAVNDGAFEAAGLDLTIEILESGPSIINGVIADQFDAGWAGTPPVLSAIQGQADLRALAGGTLYYEGGITAMLTLADSGITTWADLAGKKVATNAPRSVTALGILAAVAEDGADPNSVELIPLPFDQITTAIVNGDVDAGSIFPPYSLEALQNDPDLVDIGDPQWAPFEDAGVQLVNDIFFTTNPQYDADPATYEAFVGVITEYFGKVNDMSQEEYQEAFAAYQSMPEELASLLPGYKIAIDITEEQILPYDEAMQLVGWTTAPTDMSKFIIE